MTPILPGHFSQHFLPPLIVITWLSADKPWDWLLEGITYGNDNVLYFSCEGTKQVAATFYGIKREKPDKLDKKKENDGETDKNNAPELTKKGHLKM